MLHTKIFSGRNRYLFVAEIKNIARSRELSGNRRFNQMKYKFGLVQYGLVLHGIIYAYCIYVLHAKFWTSSLKNDRVMTILVLFGLV